MKTARPPSRQALIVKRRKLAQRATAQRATAQRVTPQKAVAQRTAMQEGLAQALAQQAVLVANLLSTSKPDQPVHRWLEYQAYAGLRRYVLERGELPEGFKVFTPDAKSVREWIAGKGNLQKDFIEEARRLLDALKTAGSGIIDDFCRFYCSYKATVGRAIAAVELLLEIEPLKTALMQHLGVSLSIQGIPAVPSLAILIEFGLLEKVCKCD